MTYKLAKNRSISTYQVHNNSYSVLRVAFAQRNHGAVRLFSFVVKASRQKKTSFRKQVSLGVTFLEDMQNREPLKINSNSVNVLIKRKKKNIHKKEEEKCSKKAFLI